jgi:outer membrane protein insertion porin family
MRVRVCAGVSFVGLLVATSPFASPQETGLSFTAEALPADILPKGAIIDTVKLIGVHGLVEEAAKSRISSRAGERFDAARLAADLRSLNQLGWFEDVSVEAEKAASDSEAGESDRPRFQLIFYVKQYPLLIAVQYSGSAALSEQRIEKLLDDQKLSPQIGMPANPVKLHLAAAAIQSELQGLGHPKARVVVAEEKLSRQRAKVDFQIHDGPRLPVRHVRFSGDPQISDSVLRKHMREIAPDAWFSGLRDKNIFTEQKGEADRLSLLTYLKNHGFPEARVGEPDTRVVNGFSGPALPWFRRRLEPGLTLDLPVAAGARYAFGPTDISADLRQKLGPKKKRDPLLANVAPGQPFSQHALDSLQRAWELKLHRNVQRHKGTGNYRLQRVPTFDSSTHLVSTRFDFDPEPPYTVRHIDFRGNERFPDRYLRRRIGITEGQSLDEYALEAGLARLARTGYFQPIKKQDIDICPHEAEHTVDVVIHLHEKGRQRTTFSGGREQFGSTLGIAYTVFNLLGMDEFISTQIDGGPETLQLAIGMAKEGFLGSRGTLALSVFDTFVRPRLTGGVQGPFQRTQSDGVNLGWSYAASDFDSLGFNFRLAHSLTNYPGGQSPGTTSSASSGIQITNSQSESSSHSLGIGWTHDTAEQKFQVTDSVSGAWLGGSENLLKSNAEYARIVPDEIINSHNAWAFRTTLGAAGNYKGDMPLYALFFPGDNLVRGLQPGELGPYETLATVLPSGSTTYSAAPAGANIIAASNLEYRVPLGHGVQETTFFDAGSGLLLPNWMGQSRPSIINSTNGLLHGSTGLELSWRMPLVGVPLRVNYSFNVLRLNRTFFMPDGSIFRVRDRLGALGWGLGPLF